MDLAPGTYNSSIQPSQTSPVPSTEFDLDMNNKQGSILSIPSKLKELLERFLEVCGRIFFNPAEEFEDTEDGPFKEDNLPQDDDAFLDTYATNMPQETFSKLQIKY
jgi:hypothetical protein